MHKTDSLISWRLAHLHSICYPRTRTNYPIYQNKYFLWKQWVSERERDDKSTKSKCWAGNVYFIRSRRKYGKQMKYTFTNWNRSLRQIGPDICLQTYVLFHFFFLIQSKNINDWRKVQLYLNDSWRSLTIFDKFLTLSLMLEFLIFWTI